MTTVKTIAEIAAPPALVRSLFLDFPRMPQWHAGHFSSITVPGKTEPKTGTESTTSAPIGEKLNVGDKLRIGLGPVSFSATVLENTSRRFVWRGGWSYILIGDHTFQFDESSSTPGGTTLTHAETFTGGLVTLCRPFMKVDEAQTSPGFEKFNADLKKWAEQAKKEKPQPTAEA